MIIEIKYRDKINWLSLNGDVVNWTNYSKKYKDARIIPHYLAPEITVGVHNGLEHDLQHSIWDAYSFDMYIKESEIKSIKQIRSSSDIQILEYNKTDAGLIISKSYNLDLQKSDYFDISEPTQVGNTSSYKVTIIFRTNRTIINKTEPVLNTNTLKISSSEWQNIGSSTAPTGTNYITSLSSTRIAVYNAGFLQAFDLILNEWQEVGNSFDTGYAANSISLVGLDTNTIALVSDTVDELSTFIFDGTDWSLSGNTLTLAASITVPTIAKLDTLSIALFDGENKSIEKYAFDGTNWAKVGNSLLITMTGIPTYGITGLTASIIAFIDTTNSEIRRYSFDGTDWSLAEAATAIVIGANVLITSLSSTEIAIADIDNSTLKKYVFSTVWAQSNDTYILENTGFNSMATLDSETIIIGYLDLNSNWQLLSSTAIDPYNTSITTLSSTRLAAWSWSAGTPTMTTYDLISNVWTIVGNSYTMATTGGNEPTLIALSSTAIAVINPNADTLQTMTFDGTDWSLTGNALALLYSGANNLSLAKLSSTTVALCTTPTGYLTKYSFDGTDWSIVGNSLTINTGPSYKVSISGLSTSEIVYLDSLNKDLRVYAFDGTDWSQSGTDTNIIIGNTIYLTSLSSTTIALIDSNNQSLRKYELITGTWTQINDTYSLPSNEWYGIATIDSTTIVAFEGAETEIKNYFIDDVNLNAFNIYISGFYEYYTDFDVIEFIKDVDNVNVLWSDGSEKTLQTTTKRAYKFLNYLNSEDSNNQIERIKASNSISINDVPIDEVVFTKEEVAIDLFKLVIEGVYSLDVVTYSLHPNNTYNLKIIGSATYNYYTDYAPEFIPETPILSTFSNESGINTPVRRITKSVKQVKFYLNETNAFALKQNFELFGTVTLDTVPVKEAREVTPNKIGVNLYEIIVNCLLSATSS